MKEQTKPDIVIAPDSFLGYRIAEAIVIDAISKGRPTPIVQFVGLGFSIFNPKAFVNLHHSAIVPAPWRRSTQIILDAYPSFPVMYYEAEEMQEGENGWSWMSLADGSGKPVNKIAVLPAALATDQASASERMLYAKTLTNTLNHASVSERELIISRISAEDLAMLRCPVSEIENFRIARHIVLFDTKTNHHMDEKFEYKDMNFDAKDNCATNSKKFYIAKNDEMKDR